MYLLQSLIATVFLAVATPAMTAPVTTKCVSGDGGTLSTTIENGSGTLTAGNGSPNPANSRAEKLGEDDVKVTVTSTRSTGTVTLSWSTRSGVGELKFVLDNGASRTFPVRCRSGDLS